VLGACAVLMAAGCSGSDSGGDDAPTSAASPGTSVAGPDGPSPTDTATDATGADDTLEEATETSIELEIPLDTAIPPDTDPPAQDALPENGPATVGGVDLPAGTQLLTNDQRLAWITDEVVTGAAAVWAELYAAYDETGLYPVLLYDDDQPPLWEQEIFFANQPYEIDKITYDEVLVGAAADYVEPARTAVPVGPASSGAADQAAADAAAAALPDTRILLVEAPSGPDAVSYMGWTGNGTYDTAEALAVALRSWEDRFGARLVAVGPNRVTLTIARPPATADEAAAVSAEIRLLVPDIDSGAAPVDVTALDDELVGVPAWTFWWLA
jgi:hypothetical protein